MRTPIHFDLFRRSHPVKRTPALVAALLALVAAGCGGASDEVGGGDAPKSASGGGAKLSLVAYSVPKAGFDKVIPLFEQTHEGNGVTFTQSYGGSGDQSR